jgi:hypothetical protein
MDYLTYGLFFLAGSLGSYLLFNRGPGPFEQTLWAGLHQGKRVIVCLDDDAFIFSLVNNKLRITRGTTDFTENPYGIVADDVDSGSNSESGNTGSSGV